MRALATSVFVASLAACSATSISVADDERACTTSDTCVAVVTGDLCAPCHLTHDALNEAAFDAFSADVSAARQLTNDCPFWSERWYLECAALEPPLRPVCDDGACRIPTAGPQCPDDDPEPCTGLPET